MNSILENLLVEQVIQVLVQTTSEIKHFHVMIKLCFVEHPIAIQERQKRNHQLGRKREESLGLRHAPSELRSHFRNDYLDDNWPGVVLVEKRISEGFFPLS
jgi:hypothetical protein